MGLTEKVTLGVARGVPLTDGHSIRGPWWASHRWTLHWWLVVGPTETVILSVGLFLLIVAIQMRVKDKKSTGAGNQTGAF